MKRTIRNFTLLLALGTVQFAGAQTGLFNSVLVQPENNGVPVDGAVFYVDGVPYSAAQVFRWQVGDVHTIRVQTAQSLAYVTDPLNGGGIPGQVATDAGLGSAYAFTGEADFDADAPASTDSENQCFQPGSNLSPGQSLCTQAQTNGELLIRIRVWPNLRSIRMAAAKFYRLRFLTHNDGCAPLFDPLSQAPLTGACGPIPGYIDITSSVVDGGPTSCSQSRITTGIVWCEENSRLRMLAVPALGYAFKTWSTQPGIQPQINGAGYGYIDELVLNNPFHMQAWFGPGKFYSLRTEPEGLEVVVDQAVIRTQEPEPFVRSLCDAYIQIGVSGDNVPVGQGGDNDGNRQYCTVWPFDSTRILAAREIQQDSVGRYWAFDRVLNTGGGQNSEFTVSGDNLATNTITWKFVPTAAVSITTQPQLNLPVIVNNRTWPAYFFHFGLNKEFTFEAPLEVVDGNGQRWRFQSWSNGGPAKQTLVVTDDMVAHGLRLLAYYAPMNKLSVVTNPAGLPVRINGVDCPHPCLVERLAEESVTVTVEPSVVMKDVLRLDFAGWSDGGEISRTVSFGPGAQALVANYTQSYRLSVRTNPANGADFTFSPESPDGFYAKDTRVNVTATARRGFRFGYWTGDAAGRTPTTSVFVMAPRMAVAEMAEVPFLDPAGVTNAAGTGPQDVVTGENAVGRVAPGSLVRIAGLHLTDQEETGPTSPQAQTLAGLVVRLNGRMLPLSFASPSYVNAQLPFDLPEGRHKLTLTRLGQPDLTAELEAVRNAPGLFGQGETATEDLPPLAWAIREDGNAVSEENPVRPNDVIDLMATGVGPYRNNPPIGFAIPRGARFLQADAVEVLVGDQVVQPVEALAAPGFVGITAVRIRVGAQFPAGENTVVRIRVNGKESNPVRLFVTP
ncbi:MAG: hypothetical protein NW208_18055 [Bryobacter sp.]|nr:hypothetical protein [Bryobacter sp.]